MNRGFFSLGSVIIIGWMVFYGCTATPEKNNFVSIEASLDTNQVTIGDVIHLTVEVGKRRERQVQKISSCVEWHL